MMNAQVTRIGHKNAVPQEPELTPLVPEGYPLSEQIARIRELLNARKR